VEAVTWERAGLDGTSIRAETHLSYTVTAALKLARLSRRLADDPPAAPRTSRFAVLASAAEHA